ncbi:MAG: RdgB/HAM1 family non-canonical purine NTP pyrophosphatase [Alphaproteobacteria bacterium]
MPAPVLPAAVLPAPVLPTGSRLVIASHNSGKVREIADLLRPWSITVLSAAELSLAEPEETEDSYAGNALLKARAAATVAGLPALADDSGFAVRALDGRPGIHSARWAGPERDFARAMHKVWDEVAAADDHAAAFICALALAWPDGRSVTVEGRVDGHIVWPPRGENGFGYDPMFVPQGESRTFGEMTAEEKHAISHRAMAFRRLMAQALAPLGGKAP